jgi:hypothetical protein
MTASWLTRRFAGVDRNVSQGLSHAVPLQSGERPVSARRGQPTGSNRSARWRQIGHLYRSPSTSSHASPPCVYLDEPGASVIRAALEVYTREQVPLDWAMTQYNLGNALGALGERERKTARLEEAATAFDACLTVMDTTAEWVPRARLRRDEIRAEIARREATK